MKTIREIADIAGVSKATMVRFIKDNRFTESSTVNRAKVYDDSSVNTIIKAFQSKNVESQFTDDESINPYTKSLEERVRDLQKMNDILYSQLLAKDKQIADLQKLTDQQQQLSLQQQTTLLPNNSSNKKNFWINVFRKKDDVY